MRNLNLCIWLCICIVFSCTKPEKISPDLFLESDTTFIQIDYLNKIKRDLKDSLDLKDFNYIDFREVYRSSDVQKKNFYLRVGFIDKNISKDFLLLFTDSAGNIKRGRI